MNIPYSEFVAALAKPGAAILGDLTPQQADLLHMAIGISGEAGELLDAVKKHTVYQKPIDRANVVEELGDLCWYMQGVMNNLDITLDEILAHNRAKLAKRYEGLVFTKEAAIARADKAVEA